jgi:hypothetical protein
VWAVGSLLCSVAICCPVMTIIGPALGLRALVQIKANPAMLGRRMALTGIIVGTVATLLWIGGFFWWHYKARLPMLNGPQAELRAGLSGNIAGFKAGFTGPGAQGSDAEVISFLHELSSRYGTFIDAAVNPSPSNPTSLADPSSLRISYLFRFTNGQVEAEALFVTFGPSSVMPHPVFKWKWIRVIDPRRGDLVYPVAEAAQFKSMTAPATAPATTTASQP